MTRPVHTEDATPVAPEPFNSLIPGPRYESTTEYSNGETRVGYGNSAEEAERKSQDYATSYHKSSGK